MTTILITGAIGALLFCATGCGEVRQNYDAVRAHYRSQCMSMASELQIDAPACYCDASGFCSLSRNGDEKPLRLECFVGEGCRQLPEVVRK